MAEMYAVSGETLTGIANAIRSKTGSDDFMTVAAMASAIEGISGGGSGFKGFVADFGEFTLDTKVNNFSYKIPHKLGHAPKFIAAWLTELITEGYISQGTYGSIIMTEPSAWIYVNSSLRSASFVYTQANGTVSRAAGTDLNIDNSIAENTDTVFVVPGINNNNQLYAGIPYRWIVAYWD